MTETENDLECDFPQSAGDIVILMPTMATKSLESKIELMYTPRYVLRLFNCSILAIDEKKTNSKSITRN